MKRFFSFLYQWIIFTPIFIVITIITTSIMIIFSSIFGNRFWGYYPPKWWARLTCWLALCRVKTSGHENLQKNTSYIFIANHQGAFDIFLVYGFLNKNMKWVQKATLRKIPFVGKASEIAGHVFVDNTSIASRKNTIIQAKKEIVGGISMMMFPEGARSKDGKLQPFRRGAYRIAMDMGLPVVPITINGPFDVLKVDSLRLNPGKLELIIHKPIRTDNLEQKDLRGLMDETKEIIYSGLWEKYK
ncbi:MAG: lysophospholipid acyltransferase family protein [Dysgonamonadaceae bacterium]|nr:lysophospholipid acyltransferase family protein [Dysgonamonadaceae bacterium]MDD3356625.1 lysophospholipid acyltransferase family protein [Dysgonamonadaceae bacterium]MDD3727034.1 lysophospholipid acyltransferase family protein [Dysgonamonadaceae bacterium]MDD4245640.1 lysophospholipid acyltransferase family protein [Dysgonamonadaceae bacterium]HUI32689.1 lysophospholipid acyltransferase family protein [Dysgonamonadaceae bacterium]